MQGEGTHQISCDLEFGNKRDNRSFDRSSQRLPPLPGKQSSQIWNNDSVKVSAFAGIHHVGQVDVGFEENPMKETCVHCMGRDLKSVSKHDNRSFCRTSNSFGVSLPSCTGSLCGNDDENDTVVTRNKVREALRLFKALCRKLLQEAEAKSKEFGPGQHLSLYCQVVRVIKDEGKCVNTGKNIIGPVPGVEVGDEFMIRIELTIVGLHRQLQGGIDYVNQGGGILATSIVASGGYDDDADASDELIYTGSGVKFAYGGKNPEDQKLERGNLALKNSMDSKTPVRVIRGEDTSDGRGKLYVYDGLYLVETYWQERGPLGKLVFKFKLVRMPDQPEVTWKVEKRFRKLGERDGVCVNDISLGKDIIPTRVVNTIDDEKPTRFVYVARVKYPDWLQPIPQHGCKCTSGCTESGNCSCVAKNGGILYTHYGAIVEVKPLVYECGPSCRCPPSCYSRVTQHGIKFQLEIFKTESRGWGVRSLNSIPSRSFICEYTGEFLDEKEAEERDYDAYLFDIGNHYNDNSLWDGLVSLMPEQQQPKSKEKVEESCFTIDAARYGNVGRFINHSCSPNLYAQNVLYDHHNKKVPHIMLFAVENIPPLQELCYDYNYKIGHVFDSDGIRKKTCYCGSSGCRGRMY